MLFPEKVEDKSEENTQKDTGDYRKIEGKAAPSVEDVPRQPSQPEKAGRVRNHENESQYDQGNPDENQQSTERTHRDLRLTIAVNPQSQIVHPES
jgi:hypothetical protein